MVNRVVVGAHYGARDWLVQRVTAVLMVLYTVALGVLLVRAPGGYEGWKELFQGTCVRIVTLVTLFAVFWHAWVGVRDVLMDYIKPAGLRLMLHVLVVLSLVVYAVLSFLILWGIK